MRTVIGLILGLLLLVGITTASGINLTSESGETWIKWSWDAGHNATVTVDGTTTISGITNGRYISADLNPSEKHTITVTNATDGAVLGELETVTAPSMIMILVILGISILFTVLLMAARDDVRGILCGILGVICSLYLAWISHQALIGLGILGLILGAINGGVIGLVLYEHYGAKKSTWGDVSDDE